MRVLLIVALCLLAGCLLAAAVAEAGNVRGYIRSDGTVVQPHFRSNPDSIPSNNYGYPGNLNPNTGQVSTGNPATYPQPVPYGGGGQSGYGQVPTVPSPQPLNPYGQ